MPSPGVKNFSRWARFPCSMEATLRPSTAPSERELFHSQKLIPISSRVRVILRTVECYNNFKSYLFFSTKLFIESTWRWNSNLRLELFYRNKHAARQVLLFGLVPVNLKNEQFVPENTQKSWHRNRNPRRLCFRKNSRHGTSQSRIHYSSKNVLICSFRRAKMWKFLRSSLAG